MYILIESGFLMKFIKDKLFKGVKENKDVWGIMDKKDILN
jgi:hypothetical protein